MRMSNIVSFMGAAGAIGVLSAQGHGAPITWNTSFPSGDWNDGTKWLGGNVPGAGDRAAATGDSS